MKTLTVVSKTTLGVAIAAASFSASLAAQQITEVARTPIADAAQLTFGYLCDDRFVVRNDGTKAVTLEYALENGSEHTKLMLDGRESVELSSRSKAPVELWMDGKRIAKAAKERRSCKDVMGNASATVTPLVVPSAGQPRYGTPFRYGAGYRFYDPWGYDFYGPFGYRSYDPMFGASFPIIIGGGDGEGRRRGGEGGGHGGEGGHREP